MADIIQRIGLLNGDVLLRWGVLFATAPQPPQPLSARIYIETIKSASRPVAVVCNDGNRYILKGRHTHNGRIVCNEQIVGCLGRALGAPVGEVAIVNVPDSLVTTEPGMAHFPSGPAHGSLFIDGLHREKQELQHYTVAENRDRLARLAVLYGWTAAGDRQFFYEDNSSRRVYSLDHGYFFVNGTWDLTSLAVMAPATIDAHFNRCSFSPAELRSARKALENVSEQMIANAVLAPPNDWLMGQDERIAMAEFLSIRRGQLLAAL